MQNINEMYFPILILLLFVTKLTLIIANQKHKGNLGVDKHDKSVLYSGL